VATIAKFGIVDVSADEADALWVADVGDPGGQAVAAVGFFHTEAHQAGPGEGVVGPLDVGRGAELAVFQGGFAVPAGSELGLEIRADLGGSFEDGPQGAALGLEVGAGTVAQLEVLVPVEELVEIESDDGREVGDRAGLPGSGRTPRPVRLVCRSTKRSPRLLT
jgi:hypothetical protein